MKPRTIQWTGEFVTDRSLRDLRAAWLEFPHGPLLSPIERPTVNVIRATKPKKRKR